MNAPHEFEPVLGWTGWEMARPWERGAMLQRAARAAVQVEHPLWFQCLLVACAVVPFVLVLL